MIIVKIGILAIIGCLIGWITNLIALKLLFRPHNEICLPFGIKLQGLLPSRKTEIAQSLGQVIEKELVSLPDILDTIIKNQDITELKDMIVEKLSKSISEKLPPFILKLAGKQIYDYVESYIYSDGEKLLHELVEYITNDATQKVYISKMVEDKINSLDFSSLEDIILDIAHKELKHIEYMGAILGFLIGIIQGVVVTIIL